VTGFVLPAVDGHRRPVGVLLPAFHRGRNATPHFVPEVDAPLRLAWSW